MRKKGKRRKEATQKGTPLAFLRLKKGTRSHKILIVAEKGVFPHPGGKKGRPGLFFAVLKKRRKCR